MTKETAKNLMEIVQTAYNNNIVVTSKWKRVNRCQAWYTGEGSCKVLRSYETVVALYDEMENVLYSYGRYSMTTYQHIRKFRDLMATENGIIPWDVQEVNLELVNNFKGRKG